MSGHRRLRTGLGVLACACAALLYRPTLDNPFVFDDLTTVLLNPALVQTWDWRALAGASTLSYAWDRALWGFSSFGFHLTNFVLHIVVVALFYGTCTRALADSVRLRPEGASAGVEWVAFLAAATFGLHPVMSATVLYVSARSEMLCAAAFMIALMFARRAILTSRRTPGLLAAGFGVIAFVSSPAAAGLPIVVLAYDAWLLRTEGWRRRVSRAYVPALAAVVLALGWRLDVYEAAAFVPKNVLAESIVVWRYLALVVVPAGQTILHDARRVESMTDPVALLSLAAIGAALAVAIRVRQTAPLVSVGVIWFFAGLAATSTLVPQRDVMAEPRVYLSAAGLILAVFAAAAPYLAARRAPRIAATAVLVILVVLTSMRLRVWSDPLLLWTEAVERSPGSWLAHLEFSEALKDAGKCDRAVEEMAAAGALNPHLAMEPASGWAPCPQPR
jgi:hypothetical protein